MHVDEMRRREPYQRILTRTLERAWSERYGREVRVSHEPESEAQPWFFQPVLGVYCAAQPSALVRRFARDGFRWTPVKRRLVPQFVLGSALSTRLGLRSLARPELWVSPPVPDADQQLILPGNQRLRIFDFGVGRVRVVLKDGFDVQTMKREISLRAEEQGPFQPLSSSAPSGDWFEEEILEGVPLPRCPPWVSKKSIEDQAFGFLRDWQKPEDVSAGDWAGSLAARLRAALERLCERYPTFDRQRVERWVHPLVERAAVLGSVAVGRTHGDLQAGNIFVRAPARTPQLIDWEHWGRRLAIYDQLSYALETRAGAGLAQRLQRFVQLGAREAQFPQHFEDGGRAWRGSTVALFLLEDLLWFLEESLSGPYLAVPEGAAVYLRELSSLGPQLERLFAVED